jgi:hypothetical protein
VSDPARRILLVSSSGGVLLDLLALKPWWSRYPAVWAAVYAADTLPALADQRVYWIEDASVRQPLRLLPGLVRAWQILRRERPALMISAGSAPAVPFYLAARALGVPSFWVSTLNVLVTPGLSAKICARLASLVLLQQASLRHAHPRGIYVGELY